MERLRVSLTVACIVLILPCFFYASATADGQAAQSLHEWDSHPPPSDDDEANAAGGNNGTKGDPDELGGGFRGPGVAPSGDQGIVPDPKKTIEPLAWLLLRLL